MKPRLTSLISARKTELKKANPRSRDRIRERVFVLEKVARLKREMIHADTERSELPLRQQKMEIAA